MTGKESYRYDGYGRRVKVTRSTDGAIDYPVYDLGGHLLTEDDARSNQTIDCVSLNGSLVAKRSAPLKSTTWTTTYEHTDALRSPTAQTDAHGNLTHTALYTPYGEPGGGTYVQGPGYTGHVTDAATHLTYAQQRYYDPVMGRFLSPDPVQADDTGGDFDRYWYANNNPYRFTDPDGRVALVTTLSDGSINVDLAINFFGNGDTPERAQAVIRAYKSLSGTYKINGVNRRVNFNAHTYNRDYPENLKNTVELTMGRTLNPDKSGRSYAVPAQGRTEIDVTDRFPSVAKHELLHLSGEPDHDGKQAQKWPGNIMTQVPGKFDARNVSEIIVNQGGVGGGVVGGENAPLRAVNEQSNCNGPCESSASFTITP